MIARIVAKHKNSFLLVRNYLLIVFTLFVSYLLSKAGAGLFNQQHTGTHELTLFFDLVAVLVLGFIGYELAKKTVIPSFVLAIFYGLVTKDLLVLITGNSEALTILTTIGATYILFGGGLEMPFNRFKSLLGPILSIALFGTIFTAFLFSNFLGWGAGWLGVSIPTVGLTLLGIALASTDPAAIIPCFKSLYFKLPRVKHIAISESALNDVVGALVTSIFLSLLVANSGASQVAVSSVTEAYTLLLNWQNLWQILVTIFYSILVGYLGYWVLELWSRWKEGSGSGGEADAALFLAVPLMSFAVANLLGGNGFLAVFITGLLFHLGYHVEHVEHFFNHSVEGFMKPMIFMLLGALVDLQVLWNYAGIGVLAALIFMFVVRPLVVFVSFTPFYFSRDNKISWQELLFLSFVRETGVIPAVLLVGFSVAKVPGSEMILAIGMWVILLTLIIQPPLTPLVAKFLGIAAKVPDFPSTAVNGATAVICSRGKSFLRRIDFVTSWCLKHKVKNVLLLHCPEDRFSEQFVQQVEDLAKNKFKDINKKLTEEGEKALHFSVLGRPGKLEDNIKELVGDDQVAIVFVGVKMLDFRVSEVKELAVPFYFMP